MEISHQVPAAPTQYEEPVQFTVTPNRAYPFFIHGRSAATVTNEYGISANSDPIYALPMEEDDHQPLPAGAQNLYARGLPLPVPEWKMAINPLTTDEPDDHDYEIV